MAFRNEIVEVFRTNVASPEVARQICLCLASSLEGSRVTFDLQDVDRILRIASRQEIQTEVATATVNAFGFQATLLPDTVEDMHIFK